MPESSLEKFLKEHPWPTEMLEGGTPLEFFWEFSLNHPTEKIWPFVADTSRLNRAIGLGVRREEEVDGKLIAHDSVLGFPQEWVEMPWEWVINKEIKVVRNYKKGVARFCRVWVLLSPQENGGTLLQFYFGWIPSNRFWRTILTMGFGRIHKQYVQLFKQINEFLAKPTGTKEEFYLKEVQADFDVQAQRSLALLQLTLKEEEFTNGLSESFFSLIAQGDELSLQRIRALPLARLWGYEQKQVIKAFLHATELGCMNISWDVVCPHCRGVRKEAKDLGEIKSQETCDVCQITFDTSAPEAVEVTFRVHPSLRKIPKAMYCAAESDKKPHIMVQTALPSKASARYQLRLASGIYRLRVVGSKNGLIFEASKETNQKQLQFRFDEKDVGLLERQSVNEDFTLSLENQSGKEKTFVLEQFWWHDDALRPAQVLCIPEFSHLLSVQHLQNDTILNLGLQTVVFTDMVASTKFYMEHGDGSAYLQVKKHFDLVFKIFEENGGNIVKTVGDAVMAAFDQPDMALRASVAVQRQFETHQEELPIRLRISLHEGSVMAVNLKTGVDYFGGAANYAAKLQSQAGAAEIVLSSKTFDHVRAIAEELARDHQTQWQKKNFSLFTGMNDGIHILNLSSSAQNKKAG